MLSIDTNIVIAAVNGRSPVVRERLKAEQDKGSRLFVSTIVVHEMDYGIAKSSRPQPSREILEAFLAGGIEILPFDRADAAEAAVLRAALEAIGKPIGPYDTLIAAQARRRGLTLVSANGREFGRVEGLALEDWSG